VGKDPFAPSVNTLKYGEYIVTDNTNYPTSWPSTTIGTDTWVDKPAYNDILDGIEHLPDEVLIAILNAYPEKAKAIIEYRGYHITAELVSSCLDINPSLYINIKLDPSNADIVELIENAKLLCM